MPPLAPAAATYSDYGRPNLLASGGPSCAAGRPRRGGYFRWSVKEDLLQRVQPAVAYRPRKEATVRAIKLRHMYGGGGRGRAGVDHQQQHLTAARDPHRGRLRPPRSPAPSVPTTPQARTPVHVHSDPPQAPAVIRQGTAVSDAGAGGGDPPLTPNTTFTVPPAAAAAAACGGGGGDLDSSDEEGAAGGVAASFNSATTTSYSHRAAAGAGHAAPSRARYGGGRSGDARYPPCRGRVQLNLLDAFDQRERAAPPAKPRQAGAPPQPAVAYLFALDAFGCGVRALNSYALRCVLLEMAKQPASNNFAKSQGFALRTMKEMSRLGVREGRVFADACEHLDVELEKYISKHALLAAIDIELCRRRGEPAAQQTLMFILHLCNFYTPQLVVFDVDVISRRISEHQLAGGGGGGEDDDVDEHSRAFADLAWCRTYIAACSGCAWDVIREAICCPDPDRPDRSDHAPFIRELLFSIPGFTVTRPRPPPPPPAADGVNDGADGAGAGEDDPDPASSRRRDSAAHTTRSRGASYFGEDDE